MSYAKIRLPLIALSRGLRESYGGRYPGIRGQGMTEIVGDVALPTREQPAEAGEKPRNGPIVNLWGVAAGCLAIVVLIVTIAENWRWGLDFFHVVGGGVWITIDLFMGLVIGPILVKMSIPARMELTRRLMPKMMVIMPPVVIATLTAGFQLARRIDMLSVPYPQHWWLTSSYIVVGLMALIAYGVMEPANILVLLELRKPHPNGALISRAMRNFIYATAAIGVLQISTAIIMTRIAS
jgi:hypothetical protein